MLPFIKKIFPIVCILTFAISCGKRGELKKSLSGNVDYGLPENDEEISQQYIGARDETIRVEMKGYNIRNKFYKLYDGISIEFYYNDANVRSLTLSREIASIELYKERPDLKNWILLLADRWREEPESSDISYMWDHFRDINFFADTGGATFVLYLPLKIPPKFVQKAEGYWQNVKSKISEITPLEIDKKKVVIMKITTFLNREKHSLDWWSPEMGLVAFDTPTSGVFHLDLIDGDTAAMLFKQDN
jgi:hypothetical protein